MQASFRAISGTTGTFNEDAIAAMQAEGASGSTYNEILISWLQIRLNSTETEINGLKAAFAADLGFDKWNDIDTFKPFPSQISDKLAVWLDAADLSTITKNGSNVVSAWGNKGNVAGVGDAVTGGSDPTYSATGLNNLPTIAFGSGNVLNVADHAGLNYTTFEVFAVASRTTDSGGPQLVVGKAVAAGNQIEWDLRLTASDVYRITTSDDGTAASAVFKDAAYSNTTGVAEIWNGYFNGTVQSIQIDDKAAATESQTAVFNGTAPFSVGTVLGASWLGNVSEVLFYTESLSAAERAAVKGYLSNKWGISL